MIEFRSLSETVLVSPQIAPADLERAKSAGVTLVVNNRPDGEADDQTPGADIEAACRSLGLDYASIPIDHSGFSNAQVEAMANALTGAEGNILAYCRSGTRSTLLWALAKARQGEAPQEIADAAARAGYDVSIIMDSIEQLASHAC